MGLLEDIGSGLSRAGDFITSTIDTAIDVGGTLLTQARTIERDLGITIPGLPGTEPISIQQPPDLAGVTETILAAQRAAQQRAAAQAAAAAQQQQLALIAALAGGPTAAPSAAPISGGGRTLATFIDQPSAFPGGAPMQAGVLGGAGALARRGLPIGIGILLEQLTNLIPGGAGTEGGGMVCPRRSPPRTLEVPFTDPCTGRQRTVHYVNRGRPLLYSGDFSAAKRVSRIASKARRRSGRR